MSQAYGRAKVRLAGTEKVRTPGALQCQLLALLLNGREENFPSWSSCGSREKKNPDGDSEDNFFA